LAAVAALVASGVIAGQAQANLVSTLQPCQATIAKESQKYLKAVLKTNQKCNDLNLKTPGSCAAPDPAKLAKAQSTLEAKIDSACGSLTTGQIENPNPNGLGFPGPCPDSDGPPFTVANIKECMVSRHSNKANDLLGDEYGGTTGPLDSVLRKCQSAVAKGAAKFVTSKLKCLETKCRSLIDKNQLSLAPDDCETEPATAACIGKALAKFQSAIANKCTDADINQLDICTPKATTVAQAQACLEQSHEEAANFLINVEHPAPPKCGDDAVNRVTEECDGEDDSACPGLCGAPTSFFPCMCTDIPRFYNRYDQNADLETGWTGKSHDGKVVDGGGYYAELSHCGTTGLGPDVCLTGTTCVSTPQFCRDDSDCPGSDTCNARQLRTLPHCSNNPKQVCRICNGGSRDGQLCAQSADCPSGTCLTCSSGAECVLSFNGYPLPIAGGGTSVCVVDTLVDEVYGSVNLATGESWEFLRENSMTFLNKSVPMPCPVCGGFCAGSGGLAGLCAADSDCPAGQGPCVLGSICNDGPNKGKPCNPNFPRGGQTAGFGVTSLDCPPSPGQNISGGGLDIAYNPFVTGVITVPAFTTCGNFKICAGSQGACTVDGDCPAGQVCKNICSGSLEPCAATSDCPQGETCNKKCAGNGEECVSGGDCPSGQVCTAPIRCFFGGPNPQKRPNDCNAACIGGLDDGLPCNTGSECSSGECRPAVCRLDPSDPNNPGPKKCSVSLTACTTTTDCPPGETCDSLNPTEGVCVAGPAYGECSIEKFRTCLSDSACNPPPTGTCPSCKPGQVCLVGNRQCFANPIVRRGNADPATPSKVAIFFIPETSSAAINSTAGVAGPGAIVHPSSLIFTP